MLRNQYLAARCAHQPPHARVLVFPLPAHEQRTVRSVSTLDLATIYRRLANISLKQEVANDQIGGHGSLWQVRQTPQNAQHTAPLLATSALLLARE